mgnify:CR=1 FL=1
MIFVVLAIGSASSGALPYNTRPVSASISTAAFAYNFGSYAGSAIAKAPPMKTAWNATRLAIAAFIIPYIFAYNNALIFVGSDVKFLSVASIVISATLGMASIAAGLMGYLIRDMKWISRVALVIGGLLMVIPGTVTDLAGLAVLVVVLVLQRIENKKDKAAASV